MKWIKTAGRRALKITAQIFVAAIGTTATLGTVDWKMVCSTATSSFTFMLLFGAFR